jgi:hypothetical protein
VCFFFFIFKKSGIGVYAGSAESYEVFKDFFDKIIEEYHNHKKDDQNKTDWDYSHLAE